MTDVSLSATRRPFFQVTGIRFRLWPILLAAVLMQAMLWPAREAARWVFKHNLELFHHQVWAFLGLAELFQIIVGLVAVIAMRRLLPQAEDNLRWPPGRTCIGLGLAVGCAMAAIMLVADYWPQLLSHTAPHHTYEMTAVGVPGWLAMMMLAGPNEEIIFRGVLVGMLTVLVPGRVRAGPVDLPFAAIVVGVLFGAAHYNSFFVDPLHQAVAQQVYAFGFGLTYVWLMERSRSLLAPMIAHGLSDALEVGAVMLLSVLWA
jgi:membrane protease YdiL (CAAX protease family)